MGSWFCDRLRLTERAVILVKKVTYFGEFGRSEQFMYYLFYYYFNDFEFLEE